MRSLAFFLLLLTTCTSLPIEPQTNELRLTSFNPFKIVSDKDSARNDRSPADQDPFINLLRDSLRYLTRTTNVTLGFIDRTSDDLFTKLKAAKQRVQQKEVIETEASDAPSDSQQNNGEVTSNSPATKPPSILMQEIVTENKRRRKTPGPQPTKQIDLNDKPKEENDFFSTFIKPWTFMDQLDGSQEHENEEESQFIGKHSPYEHGFWTDEEDELVVFPQKITVYSNEENKTKENEEKKASDDILNATVSSSTTIRPTLTIKEIPAQKKAENTDTEKSEDVPTTDPLKMKPIELENFVGSNVTIKCNESIRFTDILVSCPPANATQQFYNLAASRLKEAAPNLQEVRVDGGYVITINNESESFGEGLQFLRDHLEQIQNSLYANNIKIQSFDYVVWIFEDEPINLKDRTETLATQLQARVYPHVFTRNLVECRVELPSDYANINLTVYIAQRGESSLVLVPSRERLAYYKTLLPALDPFLQFLKAIQKSMGAVSRSMQKWVQNGQPLTVDKKKSIELELRTGANDPDDQQRKHDPILQFFDRPLRRQSNFVSAIQNAIKFEPINEEN